MRYRDWQGRLADFIIEHKTKSFKWGENDCALFALNCIRALTGQDPGAVFRGQYDDEAGAHRVLVAYNGGTLAMAAKKLAHQYGFQEVPGLFAQRGDVAMIEQDGNDTLGIVDTTGRAIITVAPQGLIYHPISMVKFAWRID